MPMPTTAKLQKPKSEDEFEDICVDFLRIRWNDSHAVRNGRRGQRQDGVDIVGHPPRLNGRTAGAQCKNTDGLKLRDVVAEAEKAKSFEGGLGEFLVITSSDRDAVLQAKVRKHFKAKPAPFRVEIIFWDDIIADLAQNERLVAKHWKGFPSSSGSTETGLRVPALVVAAQSPGLGAQSFVGRDRELAEIESLLTGATDVQLRAALHGLPGIGKTELARQVVARLARAKKFPGGIPAARTRRRCTFSRCRSCR